MIRDHFKILVVDLSSGKASIKRMGGVEQVAGGSGLAALLFDEFGLPQESWDHPDQPLIFTIGPLTGYFPLMSKTVCSFKSPYHNQYTESHAGGRSALSLRFADLDGVVIVGQAKIPSVLVVGSRSVKIKQADFLWGLDVSQSGKLLRHVAGTGAGHRSILRIGPAGESGAAMACINADTYRHFGRLGAGAVMGKKRLKAIIIIGDDNFACPRDTGYKKLYKEVFHQINSSGMMEKYHDLGTPANLVNLNKIKSLPWRNLTSTSDPQVEYISGESFAQKHLLRNLACSGCPIGCIHIGFIREKFTKEHRYYYQQMAYDYEPIFATGTMLGVTDPVAVLKLIEQIDRMGLDVISAGVALAWATEATSKGLIGQEETIVPLSFGNGDAYIEAAQYLGRGSNKFYRLLGQGTLKAAAVYGGKEFACVLGQEMAGYATGELFFTAQSLGFRHSHLDTGAYSYEQKHSDKDIPRLVNFLMEDEVKRVFLTSMVACLFARGVYTTDCLKDCLRSLGYSTLADSAEEVAANIRKMRWSLRFKTGFDPDSITIPKRFYKVTSWKGPVDKDFLDRLKKAYGDSIRELVQEGDKQ